MAFASVANAYVLLIDELEMSIGEHTKLLIDRLNEPNTRVDECDNEITQQLQTTAIWQEFWPEFCNLYERFIRRIDQFAERKLHSRAQRLDTSPLLHVAVLTSLLWLPDEWWNAASLLRDQCRPEFGAQELASDITADYEQRDYRSVCRDARHKSVGETTQNDGSNGLDRILRDILSELKRIGRRVGIPTFSELWTEPMTQQELARWFDWHRNQVHKKILSKYNHEKIGNRYQMLAKDMPLAYFFRLLRDLFLFHDRKEKSQSHRRKNAHHRRNNNAS